MGSIKKGMPHFAVNQALKYVEGNPEENTPKPMAPVDRFTPESCHENQGNAIRQVIEE